MAEKTLDETAPATGASLGWEPGETVWTASGVRMRVRARREGNLNWLFLPGGPGIGSESLHELVDAVQVPGTSWMIDLPGDGSNIDPPGAGADPYAAWPQVLLEAAQAVPSPVFVGHSTGGMYLLSTPGFDGLVAGLALVSTAPDASWLRAFVEMAAEHPLPAVAEATERYQSDQTNESLRDVAVQSAPWNFAPQFIDEGTELLGRMPYNGSAVAWSDANFDSTYESTWWPSVPTLILSGSDDRIVTQTLWNDPRFDGENVLKRTAEGGAHFLWIERPDAARAAFAELAGRITAI